MIPRSGRVTSARATLMVGKADGAGKGRPALDASARHVSFYCRSIVNACVLGGSYEHSNVLRLFVTTIELIRRERPRGSPRAVMAMLIEGASSGCGPIGMTSGA